MPDPLANIKPESIVSALKGFYTPPKPGPTLIEGEDLIEMLRLLPSLSPEDHVDTILVQVQKHHRGSSFRPEDHALLAFIDDAITQILRRTDLDFKIESFIRDLAPLVAIIGLREGTRALTKPQPVLTLIDSLIRECIGWSEDLGILGDQLMEKVELIVTTFIRQRSSLEACQQEFDALFRKENPIYDKMEERLRHSEFHVLAGQKAKFFAAEVLNQRMAGKPLPMFIIFMLQGSWYEFLQQVFVTHGQKSREWELASKITEALIWSLRAQQDQRKQLALMDSLPKQITEFCNKMVFDTGQVEACMADVEEEYRLIREGNPSDPCDFELLELDASMADGNRQVDQEAIRQIEKFKAGQWFIYDDPNESEEKVARIKLILNWQDTERLLFTNQNRRKILHMSYPDFAGYLSAETVKTLSLNDTAHEIVRQHLLTVIQGIHQQKKKEVEIVESTERKQVSQEYLARRKESLVKALEQHRKLAAIKAQRAKILREKAAKKLETAAEAVDALKVDAWVKLPIMEGTLTPCRLVAVIPGADKYIFANRAGIKVAEYTSGQLSNMIVTENSEILDTGAEFENVLASVVSGLRESKEKSYEELTGDTT